MYNVFSLRMVTIRNDTISNDNILLSIGNIYTNNKCNISQDVVLNMILPNSNIAVKNCHITYTEDISTLGYIMFYYMW
jgi:hypothetical protein